MMRKLECVLFYGGRYIKHYDVCMYGVQYYVCMGVCMVCNVCMDVYMCLYVCMWACMYMRLCRLLEMITLYVGHYSQTRRQRERERERREKGGWRDKEKEREKEGGQFLIFSFHFDIFLPDAILIFIIYQNTAMKCEQLGFFLTH